MRTDEKLHRPAEHPTTRDLPRMSRTRLWLFGSTLAVYVAIVVGVVTSSKLVTLDWQVMLFRPYKQWPQIHAFLDYFVVLGQRGPTAVMVAAWLGWRAWRQRSLHPILALGTSLLLLNITVGAVKYGLGRLGPHYATAVGSPELFAGGDIFPSGHTANAVVTWGILAYLATTPRVRRWASVIAALLALGVGMTTIYLGTHWVSDVLLGWAAGLLVLLALPWFEPAMAWAEEFLQALWRRLRHGSALSPIPAPALGSLPGLVAQRAAMDGGQSAFESVGASAGSHPAALPHAPGRPPTARHERMPVTPTGSRRPPAERPIRPTPLAHQQVRGRGAAGS
ncbi:phosphatase PAP2 family protein [Streptomyces sp. H10-C2]|uniref:phosphatase PAP2 family protein n=1 Tax=unclassified Streptomyces TaxID=2593676 RepID=UPI0024B9375D|nr:MULTISPECIES: phosphatase PAP2 family protein [unclassified Streptomyces]MDJ0343148.1 phosphatase PAP2 family protein [Streptomyces sp. PH10-H1]MDJ0371090.1 phosphatase PAP2 family protein [Streptomyces sp. H10-C2]